jgi:hypothetical protein
MVFRNRSLLAALLLILSILPAAPVPGQTPSSSFLATGDLEASHEEIPFYRRTVVSGSHAYTVGSVEMLSGPRVVWASASPRGEAVLALRERTLGNGSVSPAPDPYDAELFYWNQRTGRTVSVWRHSLQRERIVKANGVWLTGSAQAILTITRTVRAADETETTETVALVVDVLNARVRFVSVGTGSCTSLVSAPTRPVAAVVVWDNQSKKTIVRAIDGEGRLSAPILIPPHRAGGTVIAMATWIGEELEVSGAEPPTGPEEGGILFRRRVDFTRGSMIDPPQRVNSTLTPTAPMESPRLPLRLETERKPEDSSPFWHGSTLLLIADDPTGVGSEKYHERLRVTMDVDRAYLLPNLKGILYFSQSGLYLAPISRMGRDAFIAGRDAAVKREMLANLKQIISAAEQYALDYRAFPAAGSDLRRLLTGPDNYLRSDSGFHNPLTGEPSFRFTFAGGPVKFNDPAAPMVEMGRLSGPGGAYIWTNKGISWQPDGGTPMPL